MPKGIPLTEEEQANRRHEIFNAAVDLILKKGFQETSMREIAEAAGMGKSSLYDYFKTKDEILMFVIEEEGLIVMNQAQAIARLNIPPEARLKQILETGEAPTVSGQPSGRRSTTFRTVEDTL